MAKWLAIQKKNDVLFPKTMSIALNVYSMPNIIDKDNWGKKEIAKSKH